MTAALAGADFAYGNARLRARKEELLAARDFERLLGKDVDGLLGALAETAYRADVESALARSHGTRALHEAVRQHLARSLAEMRLFYGGRARELVDLLLSCFDIGNLLALVRAKAGAVTSPEDALLALVPLGWPEEALAREILRQHELAGAVELIVRWLPDLAQVRALWAAFAEYERTGELAGFERSLIAGHTERVAGRLDELGAEAATLLSFLRREVDEQNLLTGLRLRAALERRETEEVSVVQHVLPGGSVRVAALERALRLPAREGVAAELAALGRESWGGPLARWAASGDVALLERELERAWASDALRLFVAGDPLAIDVPLAFSVAKQTEARNLRLLAEAAVRRRDPQGVRAGLVLPAAA